MTQAQTIRYVKPTSTGNGNGSSWANASSDLQAMISTSAAGDQVWVATGTYKPIETSPASRTVSFAMKDGVAIYGGFTGIETNINQRLLTSPIMGQPSSSTLSGDIGRVGSDGDNCFHVINNTGLTNTAVLDGFVITGGRPTGSGLTGTSVGGGMYNVNSRPTLTNCVFQSNFSTQSSGGALANDNSNPTVTNCLFINNISGVSNFGNGLGNGGAVYNTGSSPRFINCLFQNNTAYDRGGAMFSASSSNPVLINCSFLNNSKAGNTFSDDGGGGAIANEDSNPVLVNCSFQGNSSVPNTGGALYSTGTGNFTLTNCVLFGNGGAATIFNGGSTRVSATYNLFDGSASGYAGNYNVSTNVSPFTSTTSVQLNGSACNPAINAGSNAAYTTAGGPASDLGGSPRRFNNGIIDMGAYEYQAAPPQNNQTITLTNPGVTTAAQGRPFSATFTASSGVGPYVYSIFTGNIPGITVNATTGVLSGVPLQSGNFTITVQAYDTGGCAGVSQPYTLVVSAETCPPNLQVTNTNNDGPGSLREAMLTLAITTCPGPYTITAAVSGTINLASALPDINKDVAFIGPGANNLTIRRSTGGNYRLFTILSSATATISFRGFTFSDGRLSGTANGGAILNQGGQLSIRDCIFLNNQTTNLGGALANFASLTVVNTAFINNEGRSGGGLYLGGSAQLVNCSFNRNTAFSVGAGIYSVGAISSSLTNCVFFDNGGSNTIGNAGGASVTASYNLFETAVTGYTDGGNNVRVNVSPFISTTSAQLNGSACNPAINAGSNAAYTTAGGPASDLGGSPRRFNNGIIDLGAYEYQEVPTANSRTIVVTNPGVTTAAANIPFSATFTAAGGVTPYVYTVFSGTLTPGLTLASTGVLSGRPSQTGNSTITVLASDANGCRVVSQPYTLAVLAEPCPPNLQVTNTNDAGPGSLREAMIVLAATTCPGPFTITAAISGTINLTSALPGINKEVAFIGPGANNLTIRRSAGGNYRLFTIPNSTTGTVSFTGFTFSDGQAAQADGGAILNQGGQLSIQDCIFLNNQTTNVGGALANFASLTVVNTLFQGNRSSGGVNSRGGGVFHQGSSLVLINTAFFSNNADADGGGLYLNNNAQLINCSFGGNTAARSGAAIYNIASSSSGLTNCVFFDNGGANAIISASGGMTASYSLFETGVTGYTNGVNNVIVNVSPFISTTSVQLSGCSPALNAGSNAAYTTAGGPSSDLGGRPRRFNNGVIDMGAYEYQEVPTVISISNPSVTLAATGQPFSQSFVASNGTAPYSFSLASGTLPAGLTLTSSGVVSGTPTQVGNFPIIVRATDASGCSNVSTTYSLLVGNPPTLTNFAAVPSTACVGNPVTFTATVGNVTGTYNFTLTNGVSTPISGSRSAATFSQVVISSGSGLQSYSLIVSDNGLSGEANADVTVSPFPVVSLTNSGPLSCTNTSVTLTATGGSSYTFTTSGGSVLGTPGASNTVAVTAAGTYSVRVANPSGCVSTTTTTVTSTTATVTVNNPTTRSGGTNVLFTQFFSASGGAAPRSFSVDSGSLPDGLTLSTSGVLSGTPTQGGSFTITVRATDANGCSGVGAAYVLTIVDNTPLIEDFAAATSTACVGNPVTFTATVGNVTGLYDFTLTNGVSTPISGSRSAALFSQVVTSSGTGIQSFTLIVSDNGQSARAITQLTVSPFPVVSLTNSGPLSCTNTNVTLTATGGSSYTFTTSGGSVLGTPGASNTVAVTAAGTYTVRVANPSGCVSTTTTTVTSTTATVTVNNPTTRSGGVNVAFNQTFSASGGAAPRSFSVDSGSLPDGLTLSTSGVLSGTPTQGGSFTITVRVTDANGCSGVSVSYNLSIVDNTPTVAGFEAVSSTVCVGSPVAFTATVGNVTGTYNYTLTNGSGISIAGAKTGAIFSQSLTSTGSGTQSFTLTVTDNGQSSQATTSVTVNSLPIVELNASNVCAGQAVSLSATNGLTSYTFTGPSGAIAGSGNTRSVVGLVAGTYSFSVVASNASGCVNTDVVSVTVNAVPIATLVSSGTLSCAQTSVTLTAGGGTSYTFSAGATRIGATNQATVSTAGVYSVTVANASGCTNTASTTVTSDTNPPTARILVPSSTTLTCTTPTLALTATGGGTYRWNDNTTAAIKAVSTPGTYSVTVTSPNGCTSSASVNVTADQSAPSLSITTSSTTLTCASPTAVLTAVGTGSVRWSTGATTASISVSSAGVYSVTLTAPSGCTTSSSVNVTADQSAPSLTITPTSTALTCASPTAVLTAVGSGSVRWSTGATTASISVSSAGVYSVTLTS
ncbi:putative Ig domain-containing protein, partial [Spirosoma pomorum]